MDLDDDIKDPFKVRDLWQPSKFSFEPSSQTLESLTWEADLREDSAGVFKNPLDVFDRNESLLYELNVFGTETSELEGTPESSDESSGVTPDENPETESSVTEIENIWIIEALNKPPEIKSQLQSWDGFFNWDFKEPASAYLSEFGNKGFDAALSHQATVSGLENAGRLVRPTAFLESLFRLGLGWNSIFFQYNEQKRVFEKSILDTRITGISLTALDGMIGHILQCGTDMQRIRRFVGNNPTMLEQPSALSSLASAASVMIYSLEKQLSTHIGPEITLIQIQTLFQNYGDLVGTLADMIHTVERAQSESDIVSTLLEKSEHHEQRFPWMANVLHEVIVRCTGPWLTLVETWVGLRSDIPLLSQETNMKNSFIDVEYTQPLGGNKLSLPTVDYLYRPDKMPSSVPPEQSRLLFETGKALRLLKQYQPDHPISRDDVVESSQPPTLTCAFSWIDIEQIQKKASDYEHRLRLEILRYNEGDVSRSRPGTQHGRDFVEPGTTGSGTIDNFELIDLEDARNTTGLLTSSSAMESDTLYARSTAHDFLNPEPSSTGETPFGPPLSSVLYLSLAPTLSVQAQLVDYSCLHLLFKKHHLRDHLTLQWRFQLLGDGTFASRLSHSLFDPEMNSGERKAGVARSGVHTGLRLGSRDTWPPASSELRLVLMGLLTDCHASSEGQSVLPMQPDAKEKELPGGLSFAIRELTGQELDKCKDPNAIEALDFLRLQYKPPAVLESVITSRSLHKYDRLFKYLLRLMRMVAVANGLVRDSTARGSMSGDTRNIFQRFRIDAQHFVGALNDYFLQTGVGSNWERFKGTLSSIGTCLDRGDIDGTIEIAGSLHRLRQYHEDILDQILSCLFLSKRHDQANKLLEDIFGTILTFVPLSRLDGSMGIRHESEMAVYQLYVTFRKQVGTFVRYLRNLDGGKMSSKSRGRSGAGLASPRGRETASLFEHLLLRLDMKPYY